MCVFVFVRLLRMCVCSVMRPSPVHPCHSCFTYVQVCSSLMYRCVLSLMYRCVHHLDIRATLVSLTLEGCMSLHLSTMS